ncbi:hypothetical protein RhiirA5_405759 [Rhizophagus irregularis]|uniref:Uncharacterized protein n=1 Tax=Rhizophagus irregularis TaxID=588596 RepID=A0A2I1FGM8_9GLOM|nr:hypothetical protein RhiirA5_405759 [Rhizophagus irregularis]PKC54065.1 hypothetical protein RhiirA1_478038 [Rhizophagus irregularis]PKY33542.1 hypothetical protein RhiirB3_452525 [Rhizophagus irregularis]
MGCRQSKTSQKKLQACFKVLKAAHKSQLHQLEGENSLQEEVATLTEFGVLQFGLLYQQEKLIHQQEEEVQSNNEL